MDYTALSDEALLDHENQILNEKERRQRLANIPSQIQFMSAQYVESGGNRADLESAIQ